MDLKSNNYYEYIHIIISKKILIASSTKLIICKQYKGTSKKGDIYTSIH